MRNSHLFNSKSEYHLPITLFLKGSHMPSITAAPFNSREQLQQLVQKHAQRLTWRWPLFMLIARTLLFIGFQALITLIFFLSGSHAPLADSVAWWPIVPVFANLVTLYLLSRLFRGEGSEFVLTLPQLQRGQVGKDLLILLGFMIIAPVQPPFCPIFWLPIGSTEASMKSAPSSSSVSPCGRQSSACCSSQSPMPWLSCPPTRATACRAWRCSRVKVGWRSYWRASSWLSST